MSEERTGMLFKAALDSSEKFDYFVAGAAGALVAYVGERVQPARLAMNPQTLELVALGTLSLAVVFAMKRIETHVSFLRMNSLVLNALTEADSFDRAAVGPSAKNLSTGEDLPRVELRQRASQYREQAKQGSLHLDQAEKTSLRHYRVRNLLLMIGFVLLVASRILPAYVGESPAANAGSPAGDAQPASPKRPIPQPTKQQSATPAIATPVGK